MAAPRAERRTPEPPTRPSAAVQTFRRPRLRAWLTASAALAFRFGLLQGIRLAVA